MKRFSVFRTLHNDNTGVAYPICRVAGQRRPTPGTVRLPTENRDQTSIHKAAHGLTEPTPAPPPTRHVRLRAHPGPGYGHAVDRHPTTSATSTAAVARAGPSTSRSASSKCSADDFRSSSEVCVHTFSFYPSALVGSTKSFFVLFFLYLFLKKNL